MKILHVIDSVSPERGGPVEAIKQLGLLAVASGHQVEVVSMDPPDASFLESFPLPIYATGPAILGYGYTPRLVPWLRNNALQFDVVVVNSIWQYHSFACWRALRKSSTRYVVFTHGMLDPWFKRQYPLKHLKKWLYWPWSEYRVLRDAAAVLFTCEEEQVLARQSFWLYKAKEKVVAFGTRSPAEQADFQKDQFLAAYPETEGKRVLLFMGRIHPKKGCDLVILAFAAVLANDPDWHLVIAGPDQVGWKQTLTQLAERCNISDRVTWAGMLKGEVKWGAIRAAETFFLPSHQENFGIVVAEALACGVPVLISDRVNIWREVLADEAGFVEADDLEGATLLLRRWLETSARTKTAMKAAARHCFVTRFEIHRANESLLAALSEVVSGNPHSRYVTKSLTASHDGAALG